MTTRTWQTANSTLTSIVSMRHDRSLEPKTGGSNNASKYHEEATRASAIVQDFLSGTLSIHPANENTAALDNLGASLDAMDESSSNSAEPLAGYFRISREWPTKNVEKPLPFSIRDSWVPQSMYNNVFGRSLKKYQLDRYDKEITQVERDVRFVLLK